MRFKICQISIACLLAVTGCQPTVGDKMGEVRYEVPKLPGMQSPYELPEFDSGKSTGSHGPRPASSGLHSQRSQTTDSGDEFPAIPDAPAATVPADEAPDSGDFDS